MGPILPVFKHSSTYTGTTVLPPHHLKRKPEGLSRKRHEQPNGRGPEIRIILSAAGLLIQPPTRSTAHGRVQRTLQEMKIKPATQSRATPKEIKDHLIRARGYGNQLTL